MSKSETPRWLRDELAGSLGRARAPEGLWDRIQNAGPAAAAAERHWAAWAIAAVLTLTTAVGSYWLPGPQLRADVVVLAASGLPDLRPDQPGEWDLRCTTPASRSVFRVANVSAQPAGHQFTLAMEGEATGCQACHSTGAGQHHL